MESPDPLTVELSPTLRVDLSRVALIDTHDDGACTVHYKGGGVQVLSREQSELLGRAMRKLQAGAR